MPYRDRVKIPSEPPPEQPPKRISARQVKIWFIVFILFMLGLAAVDPTGGPDMPPQWMRDLTKGY